MAPLLTDERATRRVFQVSATITEADPIATYHSQPVVPDRVTITYSWGSEWNRNPEDGKDWHVSVSFDGFMLKPSGGVGRRRVEDASSYEEGEKLPWVLDLIERHRPPAPTRELVPGV